MSSSANAVISYLPEAPEWARGYSAWLPERIQPVRRVGYTLVDLARRGLLDRAMVDAFSDATGLSDFAFRILWSDTDKRPDAESVAEQLRDASGLVIFIHGWTGTGEIFEDLPAMLVKQNPGLVALVPDVNGFGGSPFRMASPPLNRCDPPAVMRQIEAWINLLGLRPPVDWPHRRPVIGVGHSMGGASLFFADSAFWRSGELGRIALAPALLLNDRQRQRFYRTLGQGIHLSGVTEFIDKLTENFFAPRVLRVLASGASERVMAEHIRVFRNTPEGTIGQTFAAMGVLEADLLQDNWPFFRAFLAREDRLVGVEQTAELLDSINLTRDQIQIVDGDHYFFSAGRRFPAHRYNREAVTAAIFVMHDTMFDALQAG